MVVRETPHEGVPPEGVTAALLTPIADDGGLDGAAMDRLVSRVRDGGVAGLSPVGSTGEGGLLSEPLRIEAVARVVAAAEGLPVIAGVPCVSGTGHADADASLLDGTLAALRSTAEAGATAALVAPHASLGGADARIAALFIRLAERSPLPIVLYQIPALAKAGFAPEVVASLSAFPTIVGLKDSSRDMEYLRTVVRATRGRHLRVVTGTDTLLMESLAAGAVGAIAPSPCVAPALSVRVARAWIDGDLAEARELQDGLLDLVTACRRAGFPAGWKTAAHLVGVCSPRLVPPAQPPPPEAVAELRVVLERLRLPIRPEGAEW